MVTFEEALKKAKALKPGIDACDEYDKGYLFKAKSERFMIGGDGPCVVLKSTGKAVNQTEFYDNYRPEYIKEISLDGIC